MTHSIERCFAICLESFMEHSIECCFAFEDCLKLFAVWNKFHVSYSFQFGIGFTMATESVGICLQALQTAFPLTCSSALDTVTGKRVAIKKMIKIFDKEMSAKRVFREIRLMRMVHHRNVSYCRRTVL